MSRHLFGLEGFIITLERWGLTDVFLPFLLIFTIIFAVMEKTKILGTDKRNLNMIIALVISLTTIIPHVTGNYPAGFDPVLIIQQALPAVSIVAIAIIMLLLLIGLFGGEMVFLGASMPGWIAFISIATIIFIFGSSAGWFVHGFSGWLEDFFGADAVAIFIMILVFGIIIAFITGDSKNKSDLTSMQRMGMDFSKLFGKK